MSETPPQSKKKTSSSETEHSKRKKKEALLIGSAAMAAVLATGIGYNSYKILSDQPSFFDSSGTVSIDEGNQSLSDLAFYKDEDGDILFMIPSEKDETEVDESLEEEREFSHLENVVVSTVHDNYVRDEGGTILFESDFSEPQHSLTDSSWSASEDIYLAENASPSGNEGDSNEIVQGNEDFNEGVNGNITTEIEKPISEESEVPGSEEEETDIHLPPAVLPQLPKPPVEPPVEPPTEPTVQDPFEELVKQYQDSLKELALLLSIEEVYEEESFDEVKEMYATAEVRFSEVSKIKDEKALDGILKHLTSAKWNLVLVDDFLDVFKELENSEDAEEEKTDVYPEELFEFLEQLYVTLEAKNNYLMENEEQFTEESYHAAELVMQEAKECYALILEKDNPGDLKQVVNDLNEVSKILELVDKNHENTEKDE